MAKQKLVVFLIPPHKLVNGGILSIFSLCATSRQFQSVHHSKVVIATYPGSDSYKKNDLFENDEDIHSFDEIIKGPPLESLILHVPEYASWDVYWALEPYHETLRNIPELQINILNQNILLMQKPYEVANWFTLTKQVTQSTAHNSYSKQELADTYFTPVSHFSTFVDEEQYHHVSYTEKENLILFSPDEHPLREQIIATLQSQLPNYKLKTIQNLRYDDYKKLIASAKFTVTFGEGFDGYFVEGFFSNSITLTVYNEDFFPDKEFSEYTNTFKTYDEMQQNIVKTITKLDSKTMYEKVSKQNLKTINKYYSFSAYEKNLERFYRKQYTYVPKTGSAEGLIKQILLDRDATIERFNNGIKERDVAISGQSKMLAERDVVINNLEGRLKEIYTSYSWKAAKPLRGVEKVSRKVRRKK